MGCGALTPALVHHSFAAFNSGQKLTLHATVESLEWKNPHCWLEVVAPDDKGVMHEWGIGTAVRVAQ